jgi:predicted RecB family endonuclease
VNFIIKEITVENKSIADQQIEALAEIEEIVKKWVVMSKWKKDLEFYEELRQKVANG